MKLLLTVLYRIYQVLVLLPLGLLSTVFFALLAIIMCPIGNGEYWGNFSGRWWGRSLVWLSLLPLKVEGRENIKPGQSYVFVANHQGCYDIFVLFGFINVPIRWMMKEELRKVPFVGKSCEVSGQIFVDNRTRGKVKATYTQARESLRGGTSLMVFPEGRRTFTGKMSPFRRGAYLLADELQLPVVPITLNGPFHVMPRQRDFHFARWHRLTVTIHEPIMPIGQGHDNVQHLMDRSREAINSALEEKFKTV